MPLKPNPRYLLSAGKRRYVSMSRASGDRLTAKDQAESVLLTRDFSRVLDADAVVGDFGWDVAVNSGTDPSPASMKSGAATLSGQNVSQLVTAGVTGVDYYQIAIAETDGGQREEQWSLMRVETPAGYRLADKTIGEKLTLGVDFWRNVPAGVTVSSVDWAVSVETGVDAAVGDTLSGVSELYENTKALQLVIGGVADVLYRHVAKATLSDGQILHEHLLLLVIADKTTLVVGLLVRMAADNGSTEITDDDGVTVMTED